MENEVKTKREFVKSHTRRDFLQSAASVGAGLLFSPMISAQEQTTKKPDDINVALVGAGLQGQELATACNNIPSIHFKAICDIWKNYNLSRTATVLRYFKHEVKEYVDYQEMLANEKDLDAAIIATPDFCHADQTIACLKAGLHVYCETEMSNTIESAKKMAQAAKETGRFLQIGRQRRSNPRYIHCYEKLIKEAKLPGQITAINGQWNKMMLELSGWPVGTTIPDATLNKYGYRSMTQFKNWRWYNGLGEGPVVDSGAHQIDVYNWFLDAVPKNVYVSGGINYYDKKSRDWYDTVMAIYEYETAQGAVTAFYETISTNSRAGSYEAFLGNEGMLNISETDSPWNGIYREKWVSADKWKPWCDKGYIREIPEKKEQEELSQSIVLDVKPPSPPPPQYEILITLNKSVYQPHLENFFDAIRGKAKLNCPAEQAYKTAFSVLKINEAAEAKKRLDFKPEDFVV
jgi:predicted dehydrogenase